MLLLPAIDIREGQCVRLYQGRKEETTVYSEEPVAVAKLWERMGAPMLHVVDLDAAFSGSPQNLGVIKEITESVSVPVQVGGGIRSMETIEEVLSMGVKRVILGTIAINNQKLVEEAVKEFGEGIVVGIDSKNGYVAVEGWEATTHKGALQLAREMEDIGVKRIVFTDTTRDGTLQGPNLEFTRELAEKTSLKVIASGGISSMDDIKRLLSIKKYGIEGAIIGKALYTGNIKLDEALQLLKEDE
ncbi:MAG: phosphoribosylformimino-5-aminoimidazole carboxamide ribotide isomerase [Clostridia bacterium]|jgi:phosphoribosylformimino-5-aminoimidazole carboxamide ribotide isomerase|nr:phosphoribosylformimino-5-aminoimidazole carboxamide ribotide isomerase [Clostridiales bacterium]MDK2985697.1 phosphoribosylformimino-5-aminoimidazole carboxamide ribotide isomerase [Clostridia bacterium]